MKPFAFSAVVGRYCLLAWALSGGLSVAVQAQSIGSLAAEEREMIRDSWIFVFHESVPRAEVSLLAQRLSASVGARAGHVYQNSIRGFSARMSAQAAMQLATRNPQIKYYEADQIARAIAKPSRDGGGTTSPTQAVPWGITRVHGGIGRSCTGSAWVIDTGIDQTHPDLNVDKERSRNFVSSGVPKVTDGNGHGTHVAGTIGAKDNDIGVVGVCPGALLIGLRVLNDRGSGTWSDVLAGIDWVGDPVNGNFGDVANMSLGGGFSQAINDAVVGASTRVKFALAAGNEATNASTRSPASAEGPNIFTVSAMDGGDNFAASFSNYGNPPIDYAGPGVGVLSTYKGGSYKTLSGTSMAAPHVAGVLLLGGCVSGGTVKGDRDQTPDTICVFNQ